MHYISHNHAHDDPSCNVGWVVHPGGNTRSTYQHRDATQPPPHASMEIPYHGSECEKERHMPRWESVSFPHNKLHDFLMRFKRPWAVIEQPDECCDAVPRYNARPKSLKRPHNLLSPGSTSRKKQKENDNTHQ